jgi:hypothetical protein
MMEVSHLCEELRTRQSVLIEHIVKYFDSGAGYSGSNFVPTPSEEVALANVIVEEDLDASSSLSVKLTKAAKMEPFDELQFFEQLASMFLINFNLNATQIFDSRIDSLNAAQNNACHDKSR